MSTSLSLDFVSDISCPWCAIGLSALQHAIAQVSAQVTSQGSDPAPAQPLTVSLRCQPFELNPQMPPGGQDIGEHLTQKYGSTREQEAFDTSHGIHAVPAVIINGQHLVSGGQPVEVYVQALRQVAAALG